MNPAVENLATKIQSLRSEQIAAVEDFVDLLSLRGGNRALIRAELSAPAFAAIWKNPEDDVYDAI